MSCSSGASLTTNLKGLNLEEEFKRMTRPEAAGSTVISVRELGAIPKAKVTQKQVRMTPAVKDVITDAPNLSKSGKNNRKQKIRKSIIPCSKKEGKESTAPAGETGAADVDRRVPDLNFPQLDSLCANSIPEDTLVLAAEEDGDGGTTVPSVATAPKPIMSKKAGARRRRGGKRKKQKSPEPHKSSENKENNSSSQSKFEVPKSSDSDTSDVEEFTSNGGKKFNWLNVTRNGMIKKCILVHGLIEGGRPKNGDTVLVKSQGKLKEGCIVDDYPTLVFNVGEHEVIEGLDLAVQSMYKNELSIVSVKPEMAYGSQGRKADIPANSRITYLFGLMHFEKQKDISQLTWAQRRKSGQSRMRLANWWYQRKEYPVAVKCYKRALEYYNNIPTNQECTTPEEYKELLQLMEERLRVMRQVANVFKRIANMIQSGQISS
jgi:FKBP-type peptidyl-prolyl cis-trans isomerase